MSQSQQETGAAALCAPSTASMRDLPCHFASLIAHVEAVVYKVRDVADCRLGTDWLDSKTIRRAACVSKRDPPVTTRTLAACQCEHTHHVGVLMKLARLSESTMAYALAPRRLLRVVDTPGK